MNKYGTASGDMMFIPGPMKMSSDSEVAWEGGDATDTWTG
jgi:hypothetical protein